MTISTPIKTQELLLTLIRLLTPGVPLDSNNSFAPPYLPAKAKNVVSFLKQIYVPPARPNYPFPQPHTARLLPPLREVQKQVAALIQRFDIQEPEETVLPPLTTEGEGRAEPLQPRARIDGQEIRQAPKLATSSRPITAQFSPSSPIPIQTKTLVYQVRIAIQHLSTSETIETPKVPQFREALKRLKPLIDQLVDSIETHHEISYTMHKTTHESEEAISMNSSTSPTNVTIPYLANQRSEILRKRKLLKRRPFWFREEEEDPPFLK